MDHINPTERTQHARRQRAERRLATWQGIAARRNNLDPDISNPYPRTADLHSHAAMLRYRWLGGWITEDLRLTEEQHDPCTAQHP